MSNQTLPKSSKKPKEASTAKTQPARQAKGRLYRRQTARVEERRDGKPLVFGWGKHLSRRQKTKIQTRAFWIFTGVAIFAVIAVLGYSFYYVNYAVPGEPIVTVNGQAIPQSLYRKLNFYLSQDFSNQLAAIQTELSTAQQEENSSDPTTKAEGTQAISSLTTQQQTLQNEYSVPTVASLSAEDLVDDVLIQEEIPQLEAKGVPAAYLEATSQEINAKLAAFKDGFPPTVKYSQFLSSANMSEDDFRQILAILVRRDNMQNYLASQIGSTGLQVHAWILQANTQAEANKFLSQLKGLSGASLLTEWQKLAKRSSTDANTKAQGGDMGWLNAGDTSITGSAVGEQWLFNPSRKVGDVSSALTPVTGEYDMYYISAIDPHRPIDSSTLGTLKSDALTNWIAILKALPQNHIGALNSNMQEDTSNFPSSLPAGAPASTPTSNGGDGSLAG